MTGLPLLLLIAQLPVDPSRIPEVKRSFETAPAQSTMKCAFQAVPPALNFSLQYETGYTLQFPKGEFSSTGHGLDVALKVSSLTDALAPAFLANHVDLPDRAYAGNYVEVSGRFLMETGSYKIESLATDDSGRVCRGEWKVEVKSAVPVPKVSSAGGVTIFLDASPMNAQMVTLQPADVDMLRGTLLSLIRKFSTPSLRVVVFNAELEKELLRLDPFNAGGFRLLSGTLSSLQLATVDYKSASQRVGPAAFLTALLEREMADRRQYAIFLGPQVRAHQTFARNAFADHIQSFPTSFYLEYHPRGQSIGASFAPAVRTPPQSQSAYGAEYPQNLPLPAGSTHPNDLTPNTIELLMRKINGHTLSFSTPEEFTHALDRIR